MPEILLRTKLSVPPLRASLVPRPHLIERLDQGLKLGHKLTLVSAPAGFGKTTLVCEWASNLNLRSDRAKESQIANQIAWLSLDEGDDDPTRFLTYFITALKQVEGIEPILGDVALSMLRSPQPPPTNVILTSLINEVAEISDRIILVLDDYHSIEASPVDDALTFLLEHLPPQIHLVIATRDDPNLQISRLRGRDQLTELRAADLRFSASETAEFLNQVMGLDLSADDISALETRTEGWVSGLQLAAISMQGRKDVSSFIRSFTGSHRLVLDYLIEEVLNRQTQNIQTFLLRTSILNRLTGSLCGALTGWENSQETLEMLDRANLFIIPLDDERRWYRYHHLFADLLRQRLSRKFGDDVLGLHAKASAWYENNGQLSEAVRHAVNAGEFERAAQLVEQHTVAIFTRGNLHALLRWIKALPDKVLRSRPWLCVYHAWGLAFVGQLSEVDEFLEITESIVQSETQPEWRGIQIPSGNHEILGNIAAIRAYIAVMDGDFPNVIEQAQRAEMLLTPSSMWAGSVCQWAMGYAHYSQGDLDQAAEYFAEVIRYGRIIENIWTITTGMTDLASTYREQGQLNRCVSLCREALQLVNEYRGQRFGYVGRLESRLADVLCEQNILPEAIHYANSGVEKAHNWKNPNHYVFAYQVKAKVLHAQGDIQGAKTAIKEADRMWRAAPISKSLSDSQEKSQILLWISDGDLPSATRWMVEFQDEIQKKGGALENVLRLISITRVMIAQGQLDEAWVHLEKLEKLSKRTKRFNSHIEVLILSALVLDSKNEKEIALDYLHKSLTMAAKEGYVRIFVNEGPPMARLLHEALSRGISPDYVRQLLGAFPIDEPEQATSTKSKVDQSELIEPLSEREIEVLELIAEGLTNQEISSRLYITLNTVKTHTRQFYAKLGVHTRTQAVARGRALGLIRSV
jgi:LuxR family maltose regulon positive regulatory protein